MIDIVETIGGSMVQHGAFNDRAYLMKLDPEDMPLIVDDLARLCATHGYSKVFAKIPVEHEPPFLQAGYRREALVPGLYGGERDAAFLGLYIEREREVEDEAQEIERVLGLARARRNAPPANDWSETVEEARLEDIEEMSRLYGEVFATYPFPIHDPAYLEATMKENVRYFCMRDGDGRLVALSSAEMDASSRCVEMTDFATRPATRKKGMAVHLLARMDETMAEAGMKTAYTIARALSPGMNITFAKRGYTFGGTLTNNTNISGRIESMNVWYRKL
jgi:putative beta-lysine N-acetyltransferase